MEHAIVRMKQLSLLVLFTVWLPSSLGYDIVDLKVNYMLAPVGIDITEYVTAKIGTMTKHAVAK